MLNKKARRAQGAAMPVALTIAGSDSSAGAGAQADLKTFCALGVYGVTAITCIVAETPGKVSRIQPADPEIVYEQIKLLLKNFPVAAIKTGLLCSAAIVAEVVRSLKAKRRQLVVDPVMIATSGDVLLAPKAIQIYERELFPLATLITPNLDEAERLVGEPIGNLGDMHRAAKTLGKKYGAAVLLKGGHLRGRKAAIDVLYFGSQTREFSAPFVPRVKTHGTGCTYSAAITAELAKGAKLTRAIATAKKFVTSAIRSHFVWKSGREKIFALNPQSSRA
jgi:hydroxymethylpyrimidine/phosphomethylpyrimidine kinase